MINKLPVVSSVLDNTQSVVDTYFKTVLEREKRNFQSKEREQELLLIEKKNKVDRDLSNFFNENYRVSPLPESYEDLKGAINYPDYSGLTDNTVEKLNSYIDSSLSRRYITVKEYQTRHLSDASMLNVQMLHDQIFNNLRNGDTTFAEAAGRSIDILEGIRDQFKDNDYNLIVRKYTDQLYLNYAKSMSGETLSEHLESGFFNDKVTSKTMDLISSNLLRKMNLSRAGAASKTFSLEKAVRAIARGDIVDESELLRRYGSYAKELLIPYRSSQDYITMDSKELRMILGDLTEEAAELSRDGKGIDSNNYYKRLIISDLLLHRTSEIKKDPVKFGQAAQIIPQSDGLYLADTSLAELDMFAAQRAFDVQKFDNFFGVKSTQLLNKDERAIIINRFKNSSSAEERLKLVSLFGSDDVTDSFFPGSTAAAYIYNANKDPRVANVIINGGLSLKENPNLSARSKESLSKMMDTIAFATPQVRESYSHLFGEVLAGREVGTANIVATNLENSLGVKLSDITSKLSDKHKTRVPPLKVLNFGSKFPRMTPDFLYRKARGQTGDKKSKLYSGAGEDLRAKLLSKKDYIIQLYSDDGVNMYPRLIGLYDGSVSDIYFDQNGLNRFSFEWR